MWSRFRRGIAASAVALATLLTVTAQPAGAFAQRVNQILNDAVHYHPEVSTRAKDQLALCRYRRR